MNANVLGTSMGKDIKKRVVEARWSNAFHKDSASCKYHGDLQWRWASHEKLHLGSVSVVPVGRGKLWTRAAEKREEQPVKDREEMKNRDSSHRQTPRPGFYSRQVFARDGST